MGRIAKHLILFLVTLLLAFVISGAHGALTVYFGYFCFGYVLPALLLKTGRETAALFLWAVLIVLFAYVFEADQMMRPMLRPTADGWAVLLSLPILFAVMRFIFLLVDRLFKPEQGRHDQSSPIPYKPNAVARVAPPVRTGKAYRRLLGLWFLWPIGSMAVAFLDGARWDRMRYDDTLLMMMFLPPLLLTIGYFGYRFIRDRKQPSRPAETMTNGQPTAEA
ncbi:MAG: hypothetical protein ABWY00_02580 [Dongiaceae bacterium]